MPAPPPLPALRFFEAAARHLSMRRAADELHVTHGAVSQRIRSLEDYLGRPLFERLGRRIALTTDGERLHSVTEATFARLLNTLEEIRQTPRRSVLSVSVGPYMGARWLSPRLERFWRGHPHVELRLHHPREGTAYSVANVRVGIIWGQGNWPGVVCEPLFQSQLVPVCSADLLQRSGRTAGSDLIEGSTLLHSNDRRDWIQWLMAAQLPPQWAEEGPIFEDTNVMMESAVAGQGIVMGAKPLVDED